MKIINYFMIFFTLIVFVVNEPNIDEVRERREKLRSKFQTDLAECILKSRASAELKKEIEDNKEDDLRIILHNFIPKLAPNDKEIIRKCRRESFGVIRENLPDRFKLRSNTTDNHKVPERLQEKKNLK